MIVTDLLQGRGRTEDDSALNYSRALFAELFGTFALTFVAAGGAVIASVSGGEVSHAAAVVSPALLVMGMIYSIGDISGAHLNPAVTLAFVLRRAFPWRNLPAYCIAQIVGATLAALLLRVLFGMAGDVGATSPHHGTGTAVVMELLLTWILITVILSTAQGHQLVGHNAGIAVAATIALDGLFAAPISGASMNPARSLGPALVSGRMSEVWVYVVGPVAGALIATGMTWLLRGKPNPKEIDAATGDRNAS
ncbi:MAG: aquaporin [Chloroflexota bacterium]